MPKFCSNCGKPVLQNVNHCDNCGKVFEENTGTTEVSNPPPTDYGMQNPYEINPYIPPPPPRSWRPSRNLVLTGLVAVLIVILVGAVGIIGVNTHNGQVAIATAMAQRTATAERNATATAAVTPTVNPYAPYGGTQIINDSLYSESSLQEPSVPFYCQFSNLSYHVRSMELQSHICYLGAINNLGNLAFEVQMTILKGDYGGIAFRYNRATNSGYEFDVGVNGNCFLIVRQQGSSTTLYEIAAPSVNTGFGQLNTIAVSAKGNTITLFINGQQISSVTDVAFSSGTIGLIAGSRHGQADVAYTNAKVWTLVPQSNVTTQTPTTNVNPYTNTGTLALNDPLRANSLGNGWSEGADQNGACAFTGGAYHVSTLSATSAWSCGANLDLSNFAFEVQMTILKGDQGGIEFRVGLNSDYDYRFDVVQDGLYELIAERGTASKQGITTVYKFKTLINLAYSPAIHQGLGQTNIIVVVAQGSTITLYVNRQQIASVTDNNFSHGNIGLVAAANATGGHPTEVAYSNAKVWTL